MGAISPNHFPPRPPLGRFDAVTTLADFAIITYAVEPAALAALLPAGFAPEVFSLADGARVALISAVPFRDLDFRFNSFPWFRDQFCQTNYRAYIRRGEERSVWFFGTSLTTPFVAVPRHLWKLPWHGDRVRIDAAWSDERCEHYRLKTTGAWGEAEVELVGTDEPTGTLDGFADDDETAVVLTHPLAGYFHRRDGKLGTYSVWHDRFRARRGVLRKGRFKVFEDLGLVKPDAPPHSVLLQREIEFVIHLPPRRLDP